MRNFKKKYLNILKIPCKIIKKVELLFIEGYQKVFSLDHGYLGKMYPNYRGCKFVPTCSEYGYGVVKKYGIFKGNILMIKRVFRCNPWAKPLQYDPIPEK
jgi:uncharacterized protein